MIDALRYFTVMNDIMKIIILQFTKSFIYLYHVQHVFYLQTLVRIWLDYWGGMNETCLLNVIFKMGPSWGQHNNYNYIYIYKLNYCINYIHV